MDKKPNTEMAPALHTTVVDSVNSNIKQALSFTCNLSNPSHEMLYNQLNGFNNLHSGTDAATSPNSITATTTFAPIYHSKKDDILNRYDESTVNEMALRKNGSGDNFSVQPVENSLGMTICENKDSTFFMPFHSMSGGGDGDCLTCNTNRSVPCAQASSIGKPISGCSGDGVAVWDANVNTANIGSYTKVTTAVTVQNSTAKYFSTCENVSEVPLNVRNSETLKTSENESGVSAAPKQHVADYGTTLNDCAHSTSPMSIPVIAQSHMQNDQFPAVDNHALTKQTTYKDSSLTTCIHSSVNSTSNMSLSPICSSAKATKVFKASTASLGCSVEGTSLTTSPGTSSLSVSGDKIRQRECTAVTPSSVVSISTETKVTYKSCLPILSSSVQNSKATAPISKAKSSDDGTRLGKLGSDDELSMADAIGLAHGLVTGNHMENLSSKLSDTLHELAALLTSHQPDENELSSCKIAEQAMTTRHQSQSVKSLDFDLETGRSEPDVMLDMASNLDTIKRKERSKLADIARRQTAIKFRMTSIHHRMKQMRTDGLTYYTRQELCKVALHQMRFLRSEYLPDSGGYKTGDKISTGEFWSRFLQGNLQTKDQTNMETIPTTSNEDLSQSASDHKKDRRRKIIFRRLAADSTGVMKKEVRFAKRQCDPDATDTSSDEDHILQQPYQPASVPLRAGDRLSIGSNSSSFCKMQDPKCTESPEPKSMCLTDFLDWAHSRLVLRKCWTWVNAQISELEFKIRQHNDLYQKLRVAKGAITLGDQKVENQKPSTSDHDKACNYTVAISSPSISIDSQGVASSAIPLVSTSTCDISSMVDNVNRQTSNLINNLSPMSDDSPYPAVSHNVAKSFDRRASKEVESPTRSGMESEVQKSCSAARCRPLKHPVQRRKLVFPGATSALPATLSRSSLHTKSSRRRVLIYNGLCGLSSEFFRQTPYRRWDGRFIDRSHVGLESRAAVHDHCYHKNLCTPADISLSLQLNSFMASNPSWHNNKSYQQKNLVKKSKYGGHNKDSRRKPSQSERLLDSVKSRSRSATIILERADRMIKSALHRSASIDEHTGEHTRKRRGNEQPNDVKRIRTKSGDSDVEGSQRSGSVTPTFDNGHSNAQIQAVLKRKRAADQSYDINNIVIPQLTAARIEKLQYKEIITPGWRLLEHTDFMDSLEASNGLLNEDEHQTDAAYRTRHDYYEILEKKKYMQYVEWNLNNKKNGGSSGVGSRANLPTRQLEQAFLFPTSTSQPYNVDHCGLSSPPSQLPSPSPNSPPEHVTPLSPLSSRSPDAADVCFPTVRVRRLSSEEQQHNLPQPLSPASSAQELISPMLPSLLPTAPSATTTANTSHSAFNLIETAKHRTTRRLSVSSDDVVTQRTAATAPRWEPRSFPLDDDVSRELERALAEKPSAAARRCMSSTEMVATDFRPIVDEHDTNTAPRYSWAVATTSVTTATTVNGAGGRSAHQDVDERRHDMTAAFRKLPPSLSSTTARAATAAEMSSRHSSPPPKRQRVPTAKSRDFFFYDEWASSSSGSESPSDDDTSSSSNDDDAPQISEDERREHVQKRIASSETKRIIKGESSPSKQTSSRNNQSTASVVEQKGLLIKIKKS